MTEHGLRPSLEDQEKHPARPSKSAFTNVNADLAQTWANKSPSAIEDRGSVI
jgi:hypothetical protein